MDSDKKRRIRRISIPLFWIVEVFLLILLSVAIFVKKDEVSLPEDLVEAQALLPVLMADQVYFGTFSQTAMRKEDNLVQFLPPPDRSRINEWADQVRQYMNLECSVFLFDGNDLAWPLRVDRFEGFTSVVDSLVRLPFMKDSLSRLRDVGTFKVLSRFSGETGPRATIVESPDLGTRWGVVYDFKDNFFSFTRRLSEERSGKHSLELAPMAAMFDLRKEAIRPDTVGDFEKFGLQIFSQTDTLLFSTPGIDTSFHKFQQRHETMPVYSIVYNSPRNEMYLNNLRQIYDDYYPGIPWPKIFMLVFEMFVLALFYHWIDKLTRPE